MKTKKKLVLPSIRLSSSNIRSSEKIWSGLAYFLGVIGCIAAVIKNDAEKSPYIQLHALQAFIFHFVFIVANLLTSGFSVFLYVPAAIWFSFRAYRGELSPLPIITLWLIKSGYIERVEELL